MVGRSGQQAMESKVKPNSRTHSHSGENEAKEQHDEDLIFVEAYDVLLTVGSCVGIHIIKRTEDARYTVSRLKLVSAFLGSLAVSLGAVLLVLITFTNTTYDQQIVLLSFYFSYAFCIFTYIVWMKKARIIMAFLAEVDANAITMKRVKLLPVVLAGMLVYSVLYTTCIYVMLPIDPSFFFGVDLKYVLAIPVFYTSFIPSFLDMYMMSLLQVVVVALNKLETRAGAVSVWRTCHTAHLANSWFSLFNLLDTYNDIFSYLLHVRQLLFLVQMITQLFSMASVEMHGRCVLYFMLLLGCNLEVVLRFFFICDVGDQLLKAQEGVLEVVREALCHPPTTPLKDHLGTKTHSRTQTEQEDSPETARDTKTKEQTGDGVAREAMVAGSVEHLYLHNLLCRMEAKPFSVEIFGTSRLCGRTFVTLMGLVATYLLMLLQLRPYLDSPQPRSSQNNSDDDSDLFKCFSAMKFSVRSDLYTFWSNVSSK